MKKSIENLLFYILISAIVCLIFLMYFDSRDRENIKVPDVLEIYTGENIYYLDFTRLKITTEATDSVYHFRTYARMQKWISDRTAQEVITLTNRKAFEDYTICLCKANRSVPKENACYKTYLETLLDEK